MTDRDNTHEDAIDGAAGVQGAEDPDGATGADGTGEELDSEVAALQWRRREIHDVMPAQGRSRAGGLVPASRGQAIAG